MFPSPRTRRPCARHVLATALHRSCPTIQCWRSTARPERHAFPPRISNVSDTASRLRTTERACMFPARGLEKRRFVGPLRALEHDRFGLDRLAHSAIEGVAAGARCSTHRSCSQIGALARSLIQGHDDLQSGSDGLRGSGAKSVPWLWRTCDGRHHPGRKMMLGQARRRRNRLRVQVVAEPIRPIPSTKSFRDRFLQFAGSALESPVRRCPTWSARKTGVRSGCNDRAGIRRSRPDPGNPILPSFTWCAATAKLASSFHRGFLSRPCPQPDEPAAGHHASSLGMDTTNAFEQYQATALGRAARAGRLPPEQAHEAISACCLR